MSNKDLKYVAISLLVIVFVFTFCYINNNIIEVKNIDYIHDKIPEEFNGYKIMQIADLHNKLFGKKQEELVNNTYNINPDIIVITGDIIDKNKYNLENVTMYISQVINKYPIYYVSGNHEHSSNKYDIISSTLKDLGVTILDNSFTYLKRENKTIALLGVQDILFLDNNKDKKISDKKVDYILNNIITNNTIKDEEFKILLSHRPEKINIYTKNNIDLVLTGHAHGGQIRLPIIGGLYAPGQGMFPKYTDGLYNKDNTSMIVSRGLGNSRFPLRIFNLPQINVITLYK